MLFWANRIQELFLSTNNDWKKVEFGENQGMKSIFPFTDVNEKQQPTESSLDQRPRATAIERLIAYIAHIFVCVGRCVPIYAAAKLSLK